jgi:hypothetical protein
VPPKVGETTIYCCVLGVWETCGGRAPCDQFEAGAAPPPGPDGGARDAPARDGGADGPDGADGA